MERPGPESMERSGKELPPQQPQKPPDDEKKKTDSSLTEEEVGAPEGYGISREDIERMGPTEAKRRLEMFGWRPRTGGAREMPAIKVEGEKQEEEKPKTPPSRVQRVLEAAKAGLKGAQAGWREKKAERAKIKREKQIEKKIKRIEKEKGPTAAKEARKIKRGEVMMGLPRVEPERIKEKQRKRWEEMSEEERREKYSRTYELREKLKNFEKERANLVVLENELNRRNSLMAKALERLHLRKEEIPFKELQKQYEGARARYELMRAEYMGAKSWRMLKERRRLAEEEAARYLGASRFELIRKNWRWLGEQNVEALLAKFGREPQNKFLKLIAKMVSLRTLINLGLVGGGMAIGFGSAVGIGMVAARRVLGGVSTAFGSYDLMKLATEKKALALGAKQIEKMTNTEIEEKMAEFEARAKFSGQRIVRSKEYLLLRLEYKKRIEKIERESSIIPGISSAKISEAVHALDAALREQGARVIKEEKHRKVAAVGLGLFSIGAFRASDMTRFMKGGPGFTDITPAEYLAKIKEAVKKGLIVTPEQLQDSIKVEAAVPDTVLQEAAQTDTTTVAAAEAPTAETIRGIRGTVKQGGSAWQAAREMVNAGKITEEQFKEAWSSPASMVKLQSGTKIHISELGLTHAGDQVVYVAEARGVPAHFEVIDYPRDKFHIGSNQDLADAFKAEGRPIPGWLQEALGEKPTAPLEVPEIPEETLKQIQAEAAKIKTPEIDELIKQVAEGKKVVPPQELVQEAARGALEVGPRELKFDWGIARFILDNQGRIADIIVQETVGMSKRPALVSRAVQEVLYSNYIQILERDIPESVRHLYMPQRIAQAQESAWEVFRLKQVLESITDAHSSEAYFLKYKIKLLVALKNAALGARIFKTFGF